MRNAAPMDVNSLKHMLQYDPGTGEFRWADPPKKRAYLVGRVAGRLVLGYRRIKIHGKAYMAHRLAWYISTGEWPSADIDHINRIRDDNRICNLRLATASENAANRSPARGSSSAHKGVTWHRCGRWQAQIEHAGHNRYLGLYKTEDAAAQAYREAAEELFGEFARSP